MSSKRKDKNKPGWLSISRPRAHEETRLALQVLAWVPAGHDDTRRLTMDTGPLRLETGDPRLARLETDEAGPHTHTRMIDPMRAPPCWYGKIGQCPQPRNRGASPPTVHPPEFAGVHRLPVHPHRPSPPASRAASSQSNQIRLGDGLDLAVRGPPRYRKIFQTGSQAVLPQGTRAYLGRHGTVYPPCHPRPLD